MEKITKVVTFKLSLLLIFFIVLGVIDNSAKANTLLDIDKDGVPDVDEELIYKTDKNKFDTDGDGYSDGLELRTGYSPLNAKALKLEDCDYDKDGLSDRMELNFHTDLKNADTDGDGFSDGAEISKGLNPNKKGNEKLAQRIDISIYTQRLFYFLGGVLIFDAPVSSGVFDTTPKGEFKIENKSLRAWSSYGLWMPYWMAFTPGGKYGIHELPIWPNGYREGENHLGKPVSHGCVRLGTTVAKKIYDLTDIGTPVHIY